jgi:hypothetical protein
LTVKIVSGGQTGVDRAALDVALKRGVPCGGWCPTGRLDEFGRIPEHYPLKELPAAGPAERTLRNVIDSDATVIFHRAEILRGTKYTLECCLQETRPYILVDADKISHDEAADLLCEFVRRYNVMMLNVAGPRQSDWPGGYDYTFAVLDKFLPLHQEHWQEDD